MSSVTFRACLAFAIGSVLSSCLAAQVIIPDRNAIQIVGTVGKGPLTGTVRLATKREITGFKLLVSDLLDDAGGALAHDPIPGSAVTVTPAIEGARLANGLQQFALQLSPPSEAGRWKGTLLLFWEKPAPGRMELPIVVAVRTQPALALVMPQQLNYGGTVGDSIRFRFQLRETAKGSPAIGVKVLATDLRGTAGTKTVRSENIRLTTASDTLPGGDLMPVSVVINLRDVESGKYAGQLQVTDAYHNDVSIPLEVSVKDRSPLPLVVLVLGVAIGMAVSGYRALGRQRDEMNVRIGSINAQVSEAGALQQALKPLVQGILEEAKSNITAKNWDAAKEAAGRAEALIGRWRSAEEAWLNELDRIKNLRRKIDEDLTKATISTKSRRYLDRLDLAGLKSARALAEEVDKIEGWVRFFEQLKTQLDHIASEIEGISPEARREVSTTLDEMRAGLLQMNPEDQHAADVLVSNARTLAQTVHAEREKEEAMNREIDVFDQASATVIDDLKKPASKAGRPIGDMANRMRTENSSEEKLEIRRQLAENLWRGLWSAQNVLRLVTSEVKGHAAQALFDWLSDSTNYHQAIDKFREALKSFETPVLESAWPAGTLRPTEPIPPRVRQMRGKGALQEHTVVPPEVPLRPTVDGGRAEAGAGRWAWFRRLFKRGDPMAEAARSHLRLNLFQYGTYLLALVLLVWVGFNELYAASPTFGADGTKDYLVLFLWGFGAEATRSAVAGVVKTLVPAT